MVYTCETRSLLIILPLFTVNGNSLLFCAFSLPTPDIMFTLHTVENVCTWDETTAAFNDQNNNENCIFITSALWSVIMHFRHTSG